MKTTRRNAIKLGAAAAVASIVPLTATLAKEDGEIISLFKKYLVKYQECREACAAHSRVETRLHRDQAFPQKPFGLT